VVDDCNFNRYSIVILTNQCNILQQARRLENFKRKLDGIANEVRTELSVASSEHELIGQKLKIPLALYIATARDDYRKPGSALWHQMLSDFGLRNEDISDAFFVGDQAGREGDYSNIDRYCATHYQRLRRDRQVLTYTGYSPKGSTYASTIPSSTFRRFQIKKTDAAHTLC
jgi:DNA 3'-phosphatase